MDPQQSLVRPDLNWDCIRRLDAGYEKRSHAAIRSAVPDERAGPVVA
jgi:hypothetical protein